MILVETWDNSKFMFVRTYIWKLAYIYIVAFIDKHALDSIYCIFFLEL